jgi:uncharacterized membrane protein YheB (UPF0754 family)
MVEGVYVKILLPPLLGAIIGYVTNALAIRMLFRPLREYRIGPFRVPFTPGIIPVNGIGFRQVLPGWCPGSF